MENNTADRIERDIEEVRKHQQAAPFRMWAYYHEPEVSEFEIAPHDLQIQQAASYLEYGIVELRLQEFPVGQRPEERSIDWWKRWQRTSSRIENMIYGITLELLVSAIHLKLQKREYLSHLASTGLTPHINDSLDCLIADLSSDLEQEVIREVELVLELAKEIRNNLVHFGFHTRDAHFFPQLFVTVCGFLITRYADTDEVPELETMVEYLKDYHQRRSEAELFPEVSVGFEPFQSESVRRNRPLDGRD